MSWQNANQCWHFCKILRPSVRRLIVIRTQSAHDLIKSRFSPFPLVSSPSAIMAGMNSFGSVFAIKHWYLSYPRWPIHCLLLSERFMPIWPSCSSFSLCCSPRSPLAAHRRFQYLNGHGLMTTTRPMPSRLDFSIALCPSLSLHARSWLLFDPYIAGVFSRDVTIEFPCNQSMLCIKVKYP